MPRAPRLLAALVLATCALAMPPHGADAQEIGRASAPSYHMVTGVAADAALDVRAGPSAEAPVVGRLPPGAGPVEIVADMDGWGRVVAGEGGAWVSMRSLAPVEIAGIGASALPDGLVCTGAEPFWTLAFAEGAATLETAAGSPPLAMTILDAAEAAGRTDPTALWLAGAGEGVAHVERRFCSDTMSDRVYGYGVTVSVATAEARRTLSGCCRVPLYLLPAE